MASNRVQRQIDRLLDEAEEAAALKDWDTVRDRAEHALTFDPQNADGIAFLNAADRALSDSTLQPATSAPNPNEQPTSFANGRYQVQRFLGEGGKKKVYLAKTQP